MKTKTKQLTRKAFGSLFIKGDDKDWKEFTVKSIDYKRGFIKLKNENGNVFQFDITDTFKAIEKSKLFTTN